MNNIIIIIGDPIDGFAIVGPFDDHTAAIAHAQTLNTEDFWFSTLQAPKTTISI